MQRGSENLGKKGEKGKRILQSVTRTGGALIRLFGPISYELKWNTFTFCLLHDIHLTDVHFVQSQFCNPLSTNSLSRDFWARTTYLLGLGPKNRPYITFSKKKPLPHVKTINSYPKISMFFFNKFFKFQNFCYPNFIQLLQILIHPHYRISSFYYLNLKFFYLSQF